MLALQICSTVKTLSQTEQLRVGFQTLQAAHRGVLLVYVVLEVFLDLKHVELDPLSQPRVPQQVKVAPDVWAVRHPGQHTWDT